MKLRWPLPNGIPVSRGSDAHLAAGQGEGVDFACWTGTPWLSCAPVEAKVIKASFDPECGHSVWIQWFDGNADKLYRARYCHGQMPAPFGVGALVEPGEEIGWAGESGLATGPHLHLALEYWAGTIWERLRPEEYLMTDEERAELSALLDILYGMGKVLASEQVAPDTLSSVGEQAKGATVRIKELLGL